MLGVGIDLFHVELNSQNAPPYSASLLLWLMYQIKLSSLQKVSRTYMHIMRKRGKMTAGPLLDSPTQLWL